MKQLLYRLLFGCMTLLLLAACEADNAPFENNADGSNCIILNLEASSVPVRATVEGNDKENAVDHIDVFVFKTDETLFHYERLQLTAANAGKAALTKKRSEFDKDSYYKVYIVANSNLDNFADVTNLNDLKSKFQEDQDIHLTGLSNLEGVPQFFLMDGIATIAGQESGTDNTVKLNFGEKAENTELEVNLKRAAAKIIVHMKKGPQVVFSETPGQDNAEYYMRNLPYASTVLSGVGKKDILETSLPIRTEYFAWGTDEITVTAYAYEHEWEDASTLQKELRLIVNIPLTYTPEGTSESQKKRESYYQISVSRDKKLDRNTCYETTVLINAPGGSNPSEPLELESIKYTVSDWVEKIINVGGDKDRLAYLTLNEYAMEMHNIVEDNTTLEFASSSKVKATIDSVYYIDKYGEIQELKIINERQDPDEWGENSGSNYRPNWINRCTIRITPDENITGKIDVYGTVPENNAVRFVVFTVTNEDSIKRQVKVAQYPLEYITNVVGWYSTRSDFGGTTYESPGAKRYVSASYSNRSQTWIYSKNSEGFFRAKYVNRNSNGTSDIKYYTWTKYGYNTNTVQDGGSSSNSNSRMYHVQITASSGTYTLGKPRITTEGITDPGNDNAKLVSPSFMIASQLGAVSSNYLNSNYNEGINMAASHCKEYVEVAKDGTKYDDWRLPTKAEIEIIAKFQRVPGSAVDVVLGGRNYYSASEIVNLGQGNTGTYLRCIRDAYDTKK